jgi:hypothetical protein
MVTDNYFSRTELSIKVNFVIISYKEKASIATSIRHIKEIGTITKKVDLELWNGLTEVDIKVSFYTIKCMVMVNIMI